MKKYIIICLALIFPVASANAIRRCVALDASLSKCSADGYDGRVEWTGDCITNGVDAHLYGVSACSSMGVPAENSILRSELSFDSNNVDNNKNCWCRILMPAVSNWAYAGAFPNTDDCVLQCANECAYHVRANDDVKFSMMIQMF